MFGIDSGESSTSSKTIYPKGQLELNAMRLADVFSDDSNFRSFIMIKFTEVLSAIFLLPHLEFLSGWCSSDLPACEDDATLDVPRASYAHQRTSLLIKVIANLHCFVPDVCQDEKNRFVLKLVRFLQKELPAFDAERSATVSKNLSSLLGHAESLVPRFLNEDDVQLLRLFINQFEQLNTSAASGDRVRDVRNTEGCSSQDGKNGINMEEDTRGNVASKEANQLNIGTNMKLQTLDGEMKLGLVEQGKDNGSATYMRETERDARIVETSGSDSSPKNSLDQIKGGGFEESQEDEKVDAIHSDEKQQRKRKRTVMNDKQIALIESAIVDEPDMHRNAHALRSWADKLSLHGAEVTTSRLKNWLNNRKARLARAAKDVRVSYEGETGHLDSPPSPMDDGRIASSVRGSVRTEVIDSALNSSVDFDMGTTLAATQDIARSGIFFEPGQNVMLVNEKKEEVGKGKVYQVHGKWLGRILEQSGICVVDILELFVDRFTKLLHPMTYTGNTFDQAEKRLGSMRVLWDLSKMIKLPPR